METQNKLDLKPYEKFLKIYTFLDKPILLGGTAMQYYNLRQTGHDLDMMISKRDKNNLIKKGYQLNLFGGKKETDVDSTFTNIENLDLDLVITLNQYDYEYFKREAKPVKGHNNLLVMSLEDLLITKVFAQKYDTRPKHKKDVQLIIQGIEIQQGYDPVKEKGYVPM